MSVSLNKPTNTPLSRVKGESKVRRTEAEEEQRISAGELPRGRSKEPQGNLVARGSGRGDERGGERGRRVEEKGGRSR